MILWYFNSCYLNWWILKSDRLSLLFMKAKVLFSGQTTKPRIFKSNWNHCFITCCSFLQWKNNSASQKLTSYGSSNLSLTLLLITFGGPTINSYPSLRLEHITHSATFDFKYERNDGRWSTYMFSIRMVMCNVPRPLTINVSAVSPSSTFIARFLSSSRFKRSRKFLLVTYFPYTKGKTIQMLH